MIDTAVHKLMCGAHMSTPVIKLSARTWDTLRDLRTTGAVRSECAPHKKPGVGDVL
jgi:hypothetical protein